MENKKYIHDGIAHNLTDPSVIVPILMDVLNPESVIDVGCGIGTFLNVFEKNGINDILGVDGEWVNREMLSNYINLDKFQILDLEKGVNLGRRFDLAVCLEVVEHLKEESAEIIVEDLTKLSDVILFSAAIPGQGGQNHINEQWPEYWMNKFKKLGYSFHDVLRPIFWANEKVSVWYRQNMFIVVKDEKREILNGFENYTDSKIYNIVHPVVYTSKVNESEETVELNNKNRFITAGKAPIKVYFKLLIKKILRVVKLYNKK